ncbi:hypothetical protein [Escherichia phage vB-Eco-KMB37]|nr:hypothetical protein [Escherichia phage vB-Eco-KMB37]
MIIVKSFSLVLLTTNDSTSIITFIGNTPN